MNSNLVDFCSRFQLVNFVTFATILEIFIAPHHITGENLPACRFISLTSPCFTKQNMPKSSQVG